MKKIAIVYGEMKSGVQKKALEVLTRDIVEYTIEYPTCVSFDQLNKETFTQIIYIGTRQNNPAFAALENHPTLPEGYVITARDGVIYIEGTDDGGVLYGCVDFSAKFLPFSLLWRRSERWDSWERWFRQTPSEQLAVRRGEFLPGVSESLSRFWLEPFFSAAFPDWQV